jgi:predicted nucleic acid-binding protein
MIAPLVKLPYNYLIAETAGSVIRDSNKIVTFADAAIAATAIIHQLDLITLNAKVFKDIEGVNLLEIDDISPSSRAI